MHSRTGPSCLLPGPHLSGETGSPRVPSRRPQRHEGRLDHPHCLPGVPTSTSSGVLPALPAAPQPPLHSSTAKGAAPGLHPGAQPVPDPQPHLGSLAEAGAGIQGPRLTRAYTSSHASTLTHAQMPTHSPHAHTLKCSQTRMFLYTDHTNMRAHTTTSSDMYVHTFTSSHICAHTHSSPTCTHALTLAVRARKQLPACSRSRAHGSSAAPAKSWELALPQFPHLRRSQDFRSAEITEQPDTGTEAWLGTSREDMLWTPQTPDPDGPEPEVPARGVGAKGQGPWIPHGRACLQPLNKGAEALEKRPEEVAVMMVQGPAPPLRPWSTVS